MPEYLGILCIGDPHLCSRTPGFRRDDYPRVALGKLQWAMGYARRESLLPVILGDLFHFPRDNANWLAVELIRLLQEQQVLLIAGNHDMTENALTDNDTLAILVAAGQMRLLDERPWVGEISGLRVAVGGTSWPRPLPMAVDRDALGGEGDPPRWVAWLAHHDVAFPGTPSFAGSIACHEIPGVDLLINGHIHKPAPDATRGCTTWINPGNLCRVARGDATRAHEPAVLHVTFDEQCWSARRVVVPHAPFDEVFHQEIAGDVVDAGRSVFIQGLSALQSAKTGGEGLRHFLTNNVSQFENSRVRQELLALMEEVLDDAHET